jgi:hypothetical protein
MYPNHLPPAMYTLEERIQLLQVHWEQLWDLVTVEEDAKHDYFLEQLEDLIVSLRLKNGEIL